MQKVYFSLPVRSLFSGRVWMVRDSTTSSVKKQVVSEQVTLALGCVPWLGFDKDRTHDIYSHKEGCVPI